MIKIAILGYGTIGSGVVEVLDTNRESIAKRAGDEIEVKYILDLRDFPGDPMEGKVIHDYGIIAEDPEIQVVVEAMGGSLYFRKTCAAGGKERYHLQQGLGGKAWGGADCHCKRAGH